MGEKLIFDPNVPKRLEEQKNIDKEKVRIERINAQAIQNAKNDIINRPDFNEKTPLQTRPTRYLGVITRIEVIYIDNNDMGVIVFFSVDKNGNIKEVEL
jgi:hypothetical protein